MTTCLSEGSNLITPHGGRLITLQPAQLQQHHHKIRFWACLASSCVRPRPSWPAGERLWEMLVFLWWSAVTAAQMGEVSFHKCSFNQIKTCINPAGWQFKLQRSKSLNRIDGSFFSGVRDRERSCQNWFLHIYSKRAQIEACSSSPFFSHGSSSSSLKA